MSNEQISIEEIQRDADLICAELSKLIRDNSAVTNEKLDELIRLGVNISMTCFELLD